MLSHDLLNFCALLGAGVVGALIAPAVQNAMKLAVQRVRNPDRRDR